MLVTVEEILLHIIQIQISLVVLVEVLEQGLHLKITQLPMEQFFQLQLEELQRLALLEAEEQLTLQEELHMLETQAVVAVEQEALTLIME
jgi:hypothetical protein